MQQYLDKFGKLPSSTKLIVLVVLCAIVAVVYYMMVRIPEQDVIEGLNRDIASLTQTRDRDAAIAEHLDEYKAEVTRLQEDLEKAKTLLPNDREIDDLLKQVANLGKKVGLDFKLFRPLPDVPRDFYAEVPVEIQVEGDYHTVALFFSKVGQLKRIVNIQNVRMATPQEKNGKILLSVAGQAVTFRFLEGQAAAAAQGAH
ncbi:MAG TPA: type 4a pilus biogenesis protein PilO [bacterium]|nr:type 4a pilus biogenesis protein PilO [bacterium]